MSRASSGSGSGSGSGSESDGDRSDSSAPKKPAPGIPVSQRRAVAPTPPPHGALTADEKAAHPDGSISIPIQGCIATIDRYITMAASCDGEADIERVAEQVKIYFDQRHGIFLNEFLMERQNQFGAPIFEQVKEKINSLREILLEKLPQHSQSRGGIEVRLNINFILGLQSSSQSSKAEALGEDEKVREPEFKGYLQDAMNEHRVPLSNVVIPRKVRYQAVNHFDLTFQGAGSVSSSSFAQLSKPNFPGAKSFIERELCLNNISPHHLILNETKINDALNDLHPESDMLIRSGKYAKWSRNSGLSTSFIFILVAILLFTVTPKWIKQIVEANITYVEDDTDENNARLAGWYSRVYDGHNFSALSILLAGVVVYLVYKIEHVSARNLESRQNSENVSKRQEKLEADREKVEQAIVLPGMSERKFSTLSPSQAEQLFPGYQDGQSYFATPESLDVCSHVALGFFNDFQHIQSGFAAFVRGLAEKQIYFDLAKLSGFYKAEVRLLPESKAAEGFSDSAHFSEDKEGNGHQVSVYAAVSLPTAVALPGAGTQLSMRQSHDVSQSKHGEVSIAELVWRFGLTKLFEANKRNFPQRLNYLKKAGEIRPDKKRDRIVLLSNSTTEATILNAFKFIAESHISNPAIKAKLVTVMFEFERQYDTNFLQQLQQKFPSAWQKIASIIENQPGYDAEGFLLERQPARLQPSSGVSSPSDHRLFPPPPVGGVPLADISGGPSIESFDF